ncbi:uncharacterized protein LOC119657891 isoform X1 [Hermetia illucens]|uniref:uncharacterized protein LOC119657891 isoform X1 n=1 Tax=Hermetia illucens TaxID=343691 RepID=UPI0018CC5E8A|nr:uncharacterized protein LOC119657891 isoform X1 [Hermetia illucens]
MPVGGRVAGKIGYSNNNYYSGSQSYGRSYSGINEAIIWVSIGMGITIAVLITLALCYILYEKCQKKREYYITA